MVLETERGEVFPRPNHIFWIGLLTEEKRNSLFKRKTLKLPLIIHKFKSLSNIWEKSGFGQKSGQNQDHFDFVPNSGHAPEFGMFWYICLIFFGIFFPINQLDNTHGPSDKNFSPL